MRELVFGTILVAAAGAGVYFMPLGSLGGSGPDYPLTLKEAKSLLANAKVAEGQGPFGRLPVTVTAPAPNEIRYKAGGDVPAIECVAKFEPVGEKGIDVSTSCPRTSGEGAASSASKDLTEIAFAEYVASALGKRPFDYAKVNAQSAGAVMENLGTMQRDALKMQRDTQKSINDAGNSSDGDELVDDTPADDTQPMSSADYGE